MARERIPCVRINSVIVNADSTLADWLGVPGGIALLDADGKLETDVLPVIGSGLHYHRESSGLYLGVKCGPGITTNPENDLCINLGTALECGSMGELYVRVGTGIGWDGYNNCIYLRDSNSTSVGKSYVFGSGLIASPSGDKTEHVELCLGTDSGLKFDGISLMLDDKYLQDKFENSGGGGYTIGTCLATNGNRLYVNIGSGLCEQGSVSEGNGSSKIAIDQNYLDNIYAKKEECCLTDLQKKVLEIGANRVNTGFNACRQTGMNWFEAQPIYKLLVFEDLDAIKVGDAFPTDLYGGGSPFLGQCPVVVEISVTENFSARLTAVVSVTNSSEGYIEFIYNDTKYKFGALFGTSDRTGIIRTIEKKKIMFE